MNDMPTPSLNLLRLLLSKAKVVEEYLNDALQKVNLSGPKLRALTHLMQVGSPVSLSEIAGHMKCGKPNVSQLMDRLEADGFVRRVPEPYDRRSVLAEVTEAGHERYREGIKIAASVVQDLFQPLTIEKQEHLMELLSQISPW